MTNEKGIIRSLKRQIESKMILSESGRYFLPASYLSLIFTLNEVEKAVAELDCAAHDRLGLAKKIYDEGIRTFAILVKNGEEDSIIAFREHDVLDARLPLDEALATRILNQLGTAFAREYQWQFLPYKFRRHMRDHHVHISDREWILPFIGEYEVVASGGFGDVFKMQVFPSQQEFFLSEGSHVQIVRKRLRTQTGQSKEAYDKAFRNEQRCLILLNQLNHPNIVPLLASYTYEREHNFLFPAYEMDLEGFFKRGDRFADFRWNFTFYSALRGLAAALCSIHKLHLVERKHGLDLDAIGYHHDLRPANILIDRETFVLADFGLGKLKSQDSISQTQWKVGNGDYVAPECMDENFTHQEVGRAIDVWAFGCLLIEVATYIERSAAGLEEFRKLRMTQSRNILWEDSCFHDKDGSIKTAVRKWLAILANNGFRATPTAMLIDLSGKALKKEAKDRPRISDICGELTLISLKAHFTALRHVFHRYFEESATPPKGQRSAGMKFWLEWERFLAFGRTLGLDSDQVALIPADEMSALYEKAQRTMVTLYKKLERELDQMDSDALEDPDSIGEESVQVVKNFENDVSELVGSLWNLLSRAEKRKAENAWLRAMLNTEDIERLDVIGHTFGSEDDPLYEKGAATAMMKKVRLEILSNPKSVPPDTIISAKDVQVLESIDGHDIGLFKGEVQVLIEWMYYTHAWKDIPPEQRTIVMGLKAQSFGLESKSPSLRTLDCIGAFEKTGERTGYGFVYRLPMSELERGVAASTTTLLQLFAQSYRNPRQYQHRPLLGDKFRLASMLASFLREFHSIGWLHENFNSNNILFFNIKNEGSSHFPSQTLKQPHIVGLHKSRPGGNDWYTEGPGSGAEFQDYQHPEYVRTKRYRLEYDYYSFGLVLLEIGFWRPLRAWSKLEKCQRMNLAEFRQELVENYIPRLGAEMGIVYRDVVQFCLSSSANELNDKISDGSSYIGDPDGVAFKLFTENVTEPLEELAKGFI
ncbi:hypothetical protein N7G274_008593 [Stereocaulon virgatum]|uniref:Protein kinase domain-containing protein n=1 Tax=Stereocaulon virgatum TaxID=373712 RepID=A0ABR3ZZU7_9LECA